MSDLEPRGANRMTRRQRTDRAYSLVLATGGFAVLTVALVLLAILGILGGGPAVLAAIATAISGVALRRTLNP